MTRHEFEHILPEMRRLMLSVGRDFFGNDMDAEDVAQDGLIELWRYCERMDAGRSFQPLALRVAKHCCIDIMRRRRETVPLSEYEFSSQSEGGGGGLEEMEKAELQQAFDDALQLLGPSERHLFQLRQLEGLTLDEISEQTHIAKASAKSMISAARRKLFEAMKEHLPQHPKYRKP